MYLQKIMKKAQNDIDFIPSIMNHKISDAQKYSLLSSAAIKRIFCTSGGGRSSVIISLREQEERFAL